MIGLLILAGELVRRAHQHAHVEAVGPMQRTMLTPDFGRIRSQNQAEEPVAPAARRQDATASALIR